MFANYPVGTQPVGSSGSASAVTAPTGDTTRPVMVGDVTATTTSTTITASVPAATDNVAIKEYKWRLNGGAQVSTGLTRTKSYTGLSPLTPYQVEVLAYDTSDNAAVAPLIVDVVTLAAPITGYARAPDGPGYTPRHSCGPIRPANTQGSTR